MALISQMITRLEKLKANLTTLVEESFDDVKTKAAELNREQLSKGLKASGKELPPYSVSSQKRGKTGLIKLYDTGAFYGGIGALAESNKVIFFSDDSKSTMLQQKYGDDILGLTKESKIKFKPEMQAAMVENVKQIVYGKR